MNTYMDTGIGYLSEWKKITKVKLHDGSFFVY